MKTSEKCLTLHLYRKDEVLSSLRIAIITRNNSEAIFWGLELFDSNMEQDALHFLESIWLTYYGHASLGFLCRILDIYTSGQLDRISWIHLLYTVTRISERDSSIVYLLIRGATTTLEWKPNFPHKLTYTTVKEAVYDTLRRGKTLDAWLLSRAISSFDQWAILDRLAKEKDRIIYINHIRSSSLSDIEQRAAAFVLISSHLVNSQTLLNRDIPSEIQESLKEWEAEPSLRKQRVYKIRPEALLYLTARSEQPQTESSESDIQDDLIKTLLESSYWKPILDEYMVIGLWKSDTHKESFYDTYFSCDIPDEWSLADREKSHGRGLGRPYQLGLRRFVNTLLQSSRNLGVWDCISTLDTLNSLEWTQLYKDLYLPCLNFLEPPFYPIHKEFSYQDVLNKAESLSILSSPIGS